MEPVVNYLGHEKRVTCLLTQFREPNWFYDSMIAFLTDLSVIFLQFLILWKHSFPYHPHSLQQFNYSSQTFHFHVKKSTVMFMHYTVQGKVTYQPFINTIPLEWQNIILNIRFTRVLFACLDCRGMRSYITEKLIIAWKIFYRKQK